MGVSVYVCVRSMCVCVDDRMYLSLIGRANESQTTEPFMNLVWVAREWDVLKCIGVTLYDGVLLDWRQWEINIAHFSKVEFSTYYCNNSQSVLVATLLASVVYDRDI